MGKHLRLRLDDAIQELYEDKLINAVTAQFSSNEMDMLQVDMAFLRRRIIEAQRRLEDWEREYDEQKKKLLAECEEILTVEGYVEIK